jgi:hypothetical protein
MLLVSDYTSRIAQYSQANNYASATPLVRETLALQRRIAAIAKRNGFKQCSVVN